MSRLEYTAPEDPAALVIRFNDALNAGDVDAMMGLLTHDCLFEDTEPPPDGSRYEGAAAIRAFWQQFVQSPTRQWFEIEEIFGAGNRVVMRWLYRWQGAESGHVRGVDVYRIRDGRIAEKLSYVKG